LLFEKASASVQPADVEAVKTFCQKKGIVLKESAVYDSTGSPGTNGAIAAVAIASPRGRPECFRGCAWVIDHIAREYGISSRMVFKDRSAFRFAPLGVRYRSRSI
jgi:hypothetical protein